MANEADDIAQTVLDQFRKLPAKRKPAVRDNGLWEWVPLSGIVVRGTYSQMQCGVIYLVPWEF
jgi:tRNA-specific adenosine deaminase 1